MAPRTFSTRGRKVKKTVECAFCQANMYWSPGWFMVPGGWTCSNTDCQSHGQEYHNSDGYDDSDSYFDFFGD